MKFFEKVTVFVFFFFCSTSGYSWGVNCHVVTTVTATDGGHPGWGLQGTQGWRGLFGLPSLVVLLFGIHGVVRTEWWRLSPRLVCGTLGGFLALAGPDHHVVTAVTATDGWCLRMFFVALVGRLVGLGFCAVFYAAGMAPTGGDYRHCERWLSSWGGFCSFCSLPLAFAVFLPFRSYFGPVFTAVLCF